MSIMGEPKQAIVEKCWGSEEKRVVLRRLRLYCLPLVFDDLLSSLGRVKEGVKNDSQLFDLEDKVDNNVY